MKGNYQINWEVAPKDLKGFERWHKLCCQSDPLSALERFKKEGGIMPKKDDNKRTKKKVK